MLLRQLFDADTWTYTYLVADEASREALLIDPVRDRIERDLALIAELGLTLRYALDTHVHADHVTGAGLLRTRTGCKTVASNLGPESADLRLGHGARLRLGALEVHVIATPGHTDDSVSYRIGDDLFTGDALLVRGTGRTDFQNGDAGQLYDSLTQRVFTLPDHTRIWPAHDYRGHTASTVGEEKRHNPRLAAKTREQFIALMSSLGLPPPKAIQQAVPANRELGLGHGPEQGSDRFHECEVGDLGALLAQGVHVLDVREPHELQGELGHLPGAENVPMAHVLEQTARWDKGRPLLVVCRSGRRSREVCEQLAELGFTKLWNLRGGMLDYHERGQRFARS
jgi:glyoxylase-like metal-dependent hydrolase (beta-lactamase superfamily II)/rhodanese-related sulfurtransferase